MICWDAHSCVPLKPDYSLAALDRHRRSGFHFVSINIGMDINPLHEIFQTLASFRRQILAHPKLILANTIEDVERASAEGLLAVGFDLEGAIPILGNPDMIALFHALGVRQMHFAYNRRNEVAGGCYDPDIGLSPLGRRLVSACEEAGVMIDCSHISERSALEIMDIATKPVVFSHSNVRDLQMDLRNITTEMIDACAARDGVIGLTGMSRLLPDNQANVEALSCSVDFVVQRTGPRHAGIGLDYVYDREQDTLPRGTDASFWFPKEHGYDGNYYKACDFIPPEGLEDLCEQLVQLGYDEMDLSGVLGQNFLRTARRCWQPKEPAVGFP